MQNIKQMEGKSVLVFGCGELSIQLIQSLVLMKVKLVTVLCQTKDQARRMKKLADSLGGKLTKIVTEVFDPSKQVLLCPSQRCIMQALLTCPAQDAISLQSLWCLADCVLCAGGRTEDRLLLHSWGVQFSRPGIDMAVEGRMGKWGQARSQNNNLIRKV